MSEEQPPLCIDCAHFRGVDWLSGRTADMCGRTRDPVRGGPESSSGFERMRVTLGCGPSGRYFKPKGSL